MKIACLFAYHDLDRGTSAPLSVIRHWEQTHVVDYYNLYQLDESGRAIGYTDLNLRRFLDRQFSYDLCVLWDHGVFYSPFLANVRIPFVGEAGDLPQSFDNHLRKINYFDIVFGPDKSSIQKLRKKGIRAYHFPHWADDLICYPMNDVIQRYFITTTIEEGRGRGIVKWLREKLGGTNTWNDDRYFYGIDYTQYMNSGYAVFQHSKFNEWTRRIPEACACKRLVITDRLPEHTGIYDDYKPDEHVVYYNGWNQALEAILYYNNHLDEAKRIAENGYKITKEKHMASIRASQILDLVNDPATN